MGLALWVFLYLYTIIVYYTITTQISYFSSPERLSVFAVNLLVDETKERETIKSLLFRFEGFEENFKQDK